MAILALPLKMFQEKENTDTEVMLHSFAVLEMT